MVPSGSTGAIKQITEDGNLEERKICGNASTNSISIPGASLQIKPRPKSSRIVIVPMWLSLTNKEAASL